MDGKYLASNIGPLKVIGDGKVFITIHDLLNTVRFEKAEFVAYAVKNSDGRVVTVECLFTDEGIYGPKLFFRDFDFYKNNQSITDNLKLTADHGIGVGDYDITSFIELRDFYLALTTPSVEIS